MVGTRLENELALGFYRGLGEQRMDEWVTHRLVGETLNRLAAESQARRATGGSRSLAGAPR